MRFEEWFADIGQRTQAFNARDWARTGWDGHKMHGTGLDKEALEEEPLLLEYEKESL